ncbi:hypothetical protein OsI_33892 [Oryza sativa Indica Group]|uniref:Uncharacterized protein n=1 Tax=Oryza sativa subsp. indica TaxID=39946 RepID=B8BH99_ORYSI|nr:hypothetical protein OsI_33892 [Oryza sativa Indica Group]
MSECATTARMKRKEYMQLKRGMKRARTDGNEEKGRADPTYISNMELKNTLSWNMTWPKCMCRLCQGPNGIYKNIKNVVEPKYCNIQLMQLKEPSVINSAIIYSQLKKARRAKELAKIARMKRKEQNTLKRSRKGTRTNKNVITKEIISSDSKIWNFGGPTCMCQHCHALMWHAERSLHSTVKQPSFGLCCKQGKNNDEIRRYLGCKYTTATEACWRIFKFPLHYQEPPVERLSFHEENEQHVIFPDSTDLQEIIRRPRSGVTMFTEWMETNKRHEDTRELTYSEFPTKWTWDKNVKKWVRRKGGMKIGRIYNAHPASGERYYLRVILNTAKGCTTFEDIRTVNGTVHSSYKSACHALGFLNDDSEWIECIKEASCWASGMKLRQLFATVLCHCEVTDPKRLWESSWEKLSKDIQHTQSWALNFPTSCLTPSHRRKCALIEIEKNMRQAGKSLKEYAGIEPPNMAKLSEIEKSL